MEKNIHNYLRGELQAMFPQARQGRGLFTVTQIEAELNRRDDIEDKRRDHLHYPELSHS